MPEQWLPLRPGQVRLRFRQPPGPHPAGHGREGAPRASRPSTRPTNGFASSTPEGKRIGFIVSPRATNEEIFLIKEIAGRFKKSLLSTSGLLPHGEGAGTTAAGLLLPLPYDGLIDADLIIIAGANLLSNNHVLGDRVREARTS